MPTRQPHDPAGTDHTAAIAEVLARPETIRAMWTAAKADPETIRQFWKAGIEVAADELKKGVGGRVLALFVAAGLGALIAWLASTQRGTP